MSDETLPDEPMSELGQNYMAMHVMFSALREAGFTEDQALKYMAYWSIAMAEMLPPPEEEDGP